MPQTPFKGDKYYTNPDVAANLIKDFNSRLLAMGINPNEVFYVEPSGGTGSFLDALPRERRISYDLYPEHPEIIQADFLSTDNNDIKSKIPNGLRVCVIGNPPFGKHSDKAVAFLNKSLKIADVVGFILPAVFCRPSVRQRVTNLAHLVAEERLPTESFHTNNNYYGIQTVFQVWTTLPIQGGHLTSPATSGNDGVRVGDLCDIAKGSSIRKQDVTPGAYPVVSGGRSPLCYGAETNRPSETITISTGGTVGFVNFWHTPIFAGHHCATLSNTRQGVHPILLYRALKDMEEKMSAMRYGMGSPSLAIDDIANLKLPKSFAREAPDKYARAKKICDCITDNHAIITKRRKSILTLELQLRHLAENRSH